MAEIGVDVKLLEFEPTGLGREELKEKACVGGAGVSTAENLAKEHTHLHI